MSNEKELRDRLSEIRKETTEIEDELANADMPAWALFLSERTHGFSYNSVTQTWETESTVTQAYCRPHYVSLDGHADKGTIDTLRAVADLLEAVAIGDISLEG
jgi:hypothetical protein